TVSDPPFSINATSSSGLPLTFKVTGPALVSGNTLTITGSGVVSVEAIQPGNENYRAAASAAQSFTVFPAGVRIDSVVNAASYSYPAVGAYAVISGYQLASQ